ncbi:MAG: hypothetical protein ACOH14_01930 [Rhodoglobus sp.]
MVSAVSAPAFAAENRQVGAPVEGVAESSYTGEALFEAIIFGIGPAAAEVTDLATPVEQTPEALEAIEMIVAEVGTADPSYFDRLENGLQSGDVKAVDRVLQETSVIFAESLESLGYLTKEDIAAGPSCIQVVLFAAAALVVVAAGVLVVAAVSVTNVFWGPKSASDPDNSFRYEKLVSQIASDFTE